MNNANFYGRLTRDLTVSGNDENLVARTTLAVDRITKRDGQPEADFIPLVFFGARANAAEKYLRKGYRFACSCHVQTGSYTNKEGQKVYTTEFIVDTMNFVEKKNEQAASQSQGQPATQGQSFNPQGQGQPQVPQSQNAPVQQNIPPQDAFMNGLPDVNDMDLPWNQ